MRPKQRSNNQLASTPETGLTHDVKVRARAQADAHPGNILVMKGARIGLIDYGQSKQLPDQERLAFASLLVELGKGNRG